MSTVKIKTEPAAAAAATATIDVQVKLEPSLSTADIKFEQHTSDNDTKVKSDSEGEEGDIKSEDNDDDDGEDTDQIQFTITPKNQQQFICEHHGCGHGFNSNGMLKMHQHEHRLQTELNIYGKTYTLIRLSLNDRWACPFPDCESTLKAINTLRDHIRTYHGCTIGQQQQHCLVPKAQNKQYFLSVDNFYVNGVRCGYHNTIRVFICHDCRLVPECLLTHLQQKHGYEEKSINNSALPESAVIANADPNGNQHTGNPPLAQAIRNPYQQHHQDIVRGWLCVASGCGYCSYTVRNKTHHKRNVHKYEQLATTPALVLYLAYAKAQNSSFLITRIDQASGAVATSGNRTKWYKLDYSRSRLIAKDQNGDNADQNETADTSSQKRQWKCEHPDCGRFFNSSDQLYTHQREHKLEVVNTVIGMTFTLTRQTSDDRWACPVSDCESMCKSVSATREHILKAHRTLVNQRRANSEDDNDQQQQQPIIKKQRLSFHYLNVDDFYIRGTRCGYHKTTGLFICYECRLVPDCLLTHLQQKHGYDEKLIDCAFLPESARNSESSPNTNQYASNLHLASAIREPNQLHHPDITQGWLCVKFSCCYCCSTNRSRIKHQHKEHRGKQQSTVPALLLRLLYGKAYTSCFLISRLDTANDSSNLNNSTSQSIGECDEEDDGDELVLSEYSDEDDIY